jgi:hypothetical protein
MPIFHQIKDFFRSNSSSSNKRTRDKSTNIVSIKKKEEPIQSSSPPTTFSSPPKTSSNYSQLPEVEFEQSRHLLELDFFSIDNDRHQSSIITTFPKFEHLLNSPPPPLPTQQEQKKASTLNRKLTRTLKHRISVYRPLTKTVKRSVSSPQLYNN